MQSHTLHAQDVFWPIPGLHQLPWHGVTERREVREKVKLDLPGHLPCCSVVSQVRPILHTADHIEYAACCILKAISAAQNGSGLRD